MFYSGEPFFMIPERALETELYRWLFVKTGANMMLMLLLRSACRSQNHIIPELVHEWKTRGAVCAKWSYDALAEKIGVDRRTVIGWANKMEKMGLLKRISQGERKPNLFEMGYMQGTMACYYCNDMFIFEADEREAQAAAGDPVASDLEITGDPQITSASDPEITSPSDLEITQYTDGISSQTAQSTDRMQRASERRPSPSSSPREIALAGEAPTHEDRVSGRSKNKKSGRSSDQGGALLGRSTDTLKGDRQPVRTTSSNPHARRVINMFTQKYVEILDEPYAFRFSDVPAVETAISSMGQHLDMEVLGAMMDFVIENGKRIKGFNDDPTLVRIFHGRWFNKLYSATKSGKLTDLLEMEQKHTAGSAEAAAEIRGAFKDLKW